MSNKNKVSNFSIASILSDDQSSSASSPSPIQNDLELQTKKIKLSNKEEGSTFPLPIQFSNGQSYQFNFPYNYLKQFQYGAVPAFTPTIFYAQPVPLAPFQPLPTYSVSGPDYLYDTAGRKRKTRTVFTHEQTIRLEQCFSLQKYLCLTDRVGLARELGLNEAQIKTWFQNRRTKLKKQIADVE